MSTITFLVIALPPSSHTVFSQGASGDVKQNEVREWSLRASELGRLSYDSKLADELELTPDQKKRALIALQKYQVELLKLRQPTPGRNPDASSYAKQIEELANASEEILSERQSEKLLELAEQRMKSPPPQLQQSPSQRQESREAGVMMLELSRLAFDRELAEDLEVTAEQLIEIRQARQAYHLAVQEDIKARREGEQTLDFQRREKLIRDLVMKAQEILTPEQSSTLARSAKVKTLKRKFGDELALINGLAEGFGLDARQSLELREKIDETRQDYYAGIRKLREDAVKEIISELPKDRHKEVEEVLSDFLNEDLMKKTSPRIFRYGG